MNKKLIFYFLCNTVFSISCSHDYSLSKKDTEGSIQDNKEHLNMIKESYSIAALSMGCSVLFSLCGMTLHIVPETKCTIAMLGLGSAVGCNYFLKKRLQVVKKMRQIESSKHCTNIV